MLMSIPTLVMIADGDGGTSVADQAEAGICKAAGVDAQELRKHTMLI